ncbi:unnamed protein product [Orchesella dallaii]|uniref:DOMON domain-containing protein n=1 Tax=Orchesella dallaii TaxID=48710 RepID=A0ABP1S7H1_9HEXA
MDYIVITCFFHFRASVYTKEYNLLLLHLNWLIDFENCFNFVYSIGKVEYIPIKDHSKTTNGNTVFLNYNNLTSFLHISFGRWTNCQTVSFIINFENTEIETISEHLEVTYENLGFADAKLDCGYYGHYCSVFNKLKSQPALTKKPVAFYPLFLFYIIPDSAANEEKFKKLSFKLLYNNPFLQLTYRLQYTFQQIAEMGKSTDISVILKEECSKLVFICKLCEYWDKFEKRYAMQEVPLSKPRNFSRATFSNLYWNITGDGKNFTYYRLFNPMDVGKSILFRSASFRDTTVGRLWNITRSNSTMNVLKLGANRDEIILSILLEKTSRPKSVVEWNRGDQNRPALGPVTNLTSNIAIIDMQSSSYNFLTCEHSKASISVFIYFQPFQWDVWALLLITIPVTTFCIYKTTFWVLLDNRISSGSIILTLTALLLNTIVTTNELCRKKYLRLFFTVWLLTSIIISNAYRGDTLAKTTAPAESKKIEKFSQLKGFNLFTKVTCRYSTEEAISIILYCSEIGSDMFYLLIKNLMPIDFIEVQQDFFKKSHNISSTLEKFKFHSSLDKETAKTFFQLKFKPVHNNSDPEVPLSSCNKTAFVDDSNEIRKLQWSLRKKCHGSNFKYYSGKERFIQKSTSWYIQESGGYYMKRRMSYLSESGIYNFWKSYTERKVEIDGSETESQCSIRADEKSQQKSSKALTLLGEVSSLPAPSPPPTTIRYSETKAETFKFNAPCQNFNPSSFRQPFVPDSDAFFSPTVLLNVDNEAIRSLQRGQQVIAAKLDIIVDMIGTNLGAKCVDTNVPTTAISLPLETIDDFYRLESDVRTTRKMKDDLISIFSTKGGNNHNQIAYRIVDALMTDDLMTAFTAFAETKGTNLVLPHLNWLVDFQNCFNFVYSTGKVEYTPIKDGSKNIIAKTVFLNYNNLTTFLHMSFHRWTNCQTVSFIINFENTEKEPISEQVYENLGFAEAKRNCGYYGHYCSIFNKLESQPALTKKSTAFYPLFLFYILPDTTSNEEEFKYMNFKLLYNNPFLQLTYRLQYTFQQISEMGKSTSISVTLKEECSKLVFICKLCEYWDTFDKGYSMQEAFLSKPRNLSQETLSNLYLSITGDGKNLTYYRLINPMDIGKSILSRSAPFRETTLERLRSITHSNSTMNVLKLGVNRDEIILSILLEKSYRPQSVEEWNRGDQNVPAVGPVTNLTSNIAIIEMQSSSYNFLTCEHSKASISVFIYFLPFQWEVWVLLIFSIPVTTFCMQKTSFWVLSSRPTENRIRSGSIILTITALLLNTIVTTNELCREKHLRLFFTLWLLTSIIISNAYKGDTFAKTTAPAALKKIERFSQLKGFHILTNVLSTYTTTLDSISDLRYGCEIGSDMFSLLMNNLKLIDFIKVQQEFFKNSLNLSSTLEKFQFYSSLDKETAKTFFQLKFKPVLNNSNPEVLLSNCNKTAFVDDSNEIRELEWSLRKKCRGRNQKYYSGKERFMQKSSSWYIQESGGYYMKRRMSYLSESGIYNFWKSYTERKLDGLETESQCSIKTDEKVTTSSKLMSIFVVIIFCYVLTLIVLCGEVCRANLVIIFSRKTIAQSSNPSSLTFRQSEVLNETSGLILEWDVNLESRTILFTISTSSNITSYVALGLTKKGHLEEGDDVIVIGVGANGSASVGDMVATNGTTVIRDRSQDWELMNSNGSSFSIRRSLEACDEQDYSFNTDLIHVVWSEGQSQMDPSSSQLDIQFGNESRPIYFLDPIVEPMFAEGVTNLPTFRISRKFLVPPRHTSYWCSIHKMNSPMSSKHHIVGFSPYFSNDLGRRHVHHQIITRCVAPPGSDPEKIFAPFLNHPGEECYINNNTQLPYPYCREFLHEWAVGGKDVPFPDSVGFSIGENPGNQYFLYETHFDNPEVRDDLELETGVDFHYTPNLRENDGGILLVGAGVFATWAMPPETTEFDVAGHCNPRCTTTMFPPEGVQVLGARLHAHLSSRRIRIKHFRNGAELPWIQNDDNYDFNFQQWRLLYNPVTLLPGDQITVQCGYDNVWKNDSSATVSGYSTRNEMCVGWLMLSKRIPHSFCSSEYPTENVMERFGIQNMTWDLDSNERIIRAANDPQYVGLTFTEMMTRVMGNWPPEQKLEWENELLESQHVASCPNVRIVGSVLYYISALEQILPGGIVLPIPQNVRDGYGSSDRLISTPGRSSTARYPTEVAPFTPPSSCPAGNQPEGGEGQETIDAAEAVRRFGEAWNLLRRINRIGG